MVALDGVAALFVSVILANLAPVLLLPLFYKLTPLPAGEVRAKALALAALARTRVRGVYSMNMSAKTTAANAAVMGLGNTRRIVIGDTLLDRYTPDEIEVVVAHELGHQVHRDIPKLIAVQSVVTLGGFYLASLTLNLVVTNVPGYHGLSDPATMPLLAAVLGIFGLVDPAAQQWLQSPGGESGRWLRARLDRQGRSLHQRDDAPGEPESRRVDASRLGRVLPLRPSLHWQTSRLRRPLRRGSTTAAPLLQRTMD